MLNTPASTSNSFTYLTVVKRFGANGEAAQLDGLLEARGNVQLLEFLVGIPGKLICTQFPTLLCQRIQGVTNNKVKEK